MPKLEPKVTQLVNAKARSQTRAWLSPKHDSQAPSVSQILLPVSIPHASIARASQWTFSHTESLFFY